MANFDYHSNTTNNYLLDFKILYMCPIDSMYKTVGSQITKNVNPSTCTSSYMEESSFESAKFGITEIYILLIPSE